MLENQQFDLPPKKNLPFENKTEDILGDLGVVIEKKELSPQEIITPIIPEPEKESPPLEEEIEETAEEEKPELEEEVREVLEEELAETPVFEDIIEENEGKDFETIITEEPFEEIKEGKEIPPLPKKVLMSQKEKVHIMPFLKRGLKILLIGIGIIALLSLSYPAYLFFYQPASHFKAGLNYIQFGEFKKGEDEFKEGLNLTRDNFTRCNAYNRFGMAYLKEKEYKKAEEKFKKALQISPTNLVSKNNLIKLYIKKGKIQKGEKMCKEILEVHPDNIPAYINLSKILLITSRPQGAIRCLKYALVLNKKNIEALSLYQHALAKTGKYREALSIHRYLYHLTKGKYLYYPDDLTDIGHIYLKKGDLSTSSDVFNRVLKHYPKHGLARFLSSQVLLQEHKVDEAIKELEKTTRYHPDYDDAYTLLGKAYYDKKIYDKALLRFRKAVMINPKNGEAFEGMGNIYYYQLNAYQEAVNSYTKALEHGVSSPQIKYNLGVSLYKAGNFNKSLEFWESLLATREKDATLDFNLATTQVQLHNLEQAKSKYESLINFYKEKIKAGVRPKVKKNLFQELSLIYNNLGVILELQEGGKKALSSYWQSLEFASLADGENPIAYNNLNRIFNAEALKSINQGLNEVKKEYEIENIEEGKEGISPEGKESHTPQIEHKSHE